MSSSPTSTGSPCPARPGPGQAALSLVLPIERPGGDVEHLQAVMRKITLVVRVMRASSTWCRLLCKRAATLAGLTARVAGRKGRSFIGFFIFSLCSFPTALVCAYIVRDRRFLAHSSFLLLRYRGPTALILPRMVSAIGYPRLAQSLPSATTRRAFPLLFTPS